MAQLTASPKELHLLPKQRAKILITKEDDVFDPMLVRLDTKEHYIATVAPESLSIESTAQENQWTVVVTALELGHTTLFAHIMDLDGNCISILPGLVQVTVQQSHLLAVLGAICGWLYFTAWSASFYPQIYENWKRKSVIGFNFDYVTLNQLGYVCYSMFNVCLYYVPSIQAEYFRRHPGGTNPVQLNDVVFSLHGLFGTAYMILQVFMYERGDQSLSTTGRSLLMLGVGILLSLLAMVSFDSMMWLDYLYYCSYIKLAVTITKYIPQVIMNYRLKSTIGWSIGAVLCDFTGSIFSTLQMIVISYNCDDWVSIMGDPTKFGLGLFSTMFDVIFLVQHFVLYRHREETTDTKQSDEFTGKKGPFCMPF